MPAAKLAGEAGNEDNAAESGAGEAAKDGKGKGQQAGEEATPAAKKGRAAKPKPTPATVEGTGTGGRARRERKQVRACRTAATRQEHVANCGIWVIALNPRKPLIFGSMLRLACAPATTHPVVYGLRLPGLAAGLRAQPCPCSST